MTVLTQPAIDSSTKCLTKPGKAVPLSSSKKCHHSLKEKQASGLNPSPIYENRIGSSHSYADLAHSYARSRHYTISTVDFRNTTMATILDEAINDILQEQLPRICSSLKRRPTQFPLEVRHAADKGLGSFATSPITAGSTIFMEFPSIIAPSIYGLAIPPSEAYTELFESLPKHDLAFVSSLATSRQDHPGSKPVPQVSSLPHPSFYEDIMQTNSISVNLHIPSDIPHPELSTHRALFFMLSRCNHSCSPNAQWSWDASTLTLTVTALRPIATGEEITISYIPLYSDPTLRQQILKDAYGFDCVCDECTLPPYEVEEHRSATVDKPDYTSDGDNVTMDSSNLESLRSASLDVPILPEVHSDHDQKVQQYWEDQTFYTNIGGSSTLDVADAIDKHTEIIAMCYGALGDVMNFRNWIACVKEAKVSKGADADVRIVFNKWLANPSSFPYWNRKARAF
ncbi:hypothetical protein AGABI2DRAFT_181453 [Agaricus bisporus var. bisporus H97]|uniref:hypothetical protein n=1 Tax=Agaricus bisporus var. bisporus (strain H97 / ATCC MYA-4626 / FGSC 10389) TaxID=936046 RepID=UPI00029F6CE4|nr:hypothetical protein AGABI2DRAFT_181453 [Agaricus bisporus var. bisporus H97]EKV42243.1 hypothetical protein AGABI2DRAFT_181453 [Agaricus bisporus var. bisporus H97]